MKQSYSTRTRSKAIAIIDRNHVLIRLLPSPRRMEFSETTAGGYGLLASGQRAENVARARQLLMPPIIPVDAIKAIDANAAQTPTAKHACPCCGGRMIIIERFEPGPDVLTDPAYWTDEPIDED